MDIKIAGGILALQVWDILDDDEEDNVVTNLKKIRLEKIFNYVEEIVPKMSYNQFRVHFRMNQTTFEDLIAKLHSVNDQTTLKRGQPEVPVEKRCLITVWCLANPECFRSVADRFGVSISTCWRILYLTCHDILKTNKKYKIVAWPSAERADGISNYFARKTNLIGIIGCIDGSHIPIKAPKNSPASYVNRKGFHSILLQAVCDHELLFTDCYAGEAGSIHDALLYQRSDLNKAIQGGAVQFPNNSYMVGDAAYALKHYLITPFKDNGYLSNRQKNFNKTISKARQCIERAFALLKGRFRRLKFLETVRHDLATLIIISACIMHNICILQGDILEDNLELQEDNPVILDAVFNEERPARDAINKRNEIVNSLPI